MSVKSGPYLNSNRERQIQKDYGTQTDDRNKPSNDRGDPLYRMQQEALAKLRRGVAGTSELKPIRTK